MTFGDALEQVKAGRQIRRPAFLSGVYIECAYTDLMRPYLVICDRVERVPYIVRNGDIFADDWEVLP